MLKKIKHLVLGQSLRSDALDHEKFSVIWGLPVLSSDAISSVSYACEEILMVLIPVLGMASYGLLMKVGFAIDHGKDYWTGTIYTTNRRVWEYDNDFKEYLRSTHATGIDMETATLLTAGFANQIPTGALLMISDKPMEEDGVKTEASDRKVTQQFVGEQVMLGVEALQQILDGKKTIRHIRFSW